MDYFWYYRPKVGFPPPPVSSPDDYEPSDRLALAVPQTDLSPGKQRALVQRWCALLPTLREVRILWFHIRVPQALFDAACRMPSLEGMWISDSGITDLAIVETLESLRYFHLGSSTALRSIDPLAKLRTLKWLGLENVKRITDLSPLSGLTALEGLTLEGSMWTTQRVRSLAPLSSLTQLRYLSLANLRANDRTLAPLFNLRNLENLIVAQWWDAAELEEIRRRNPKLAA